MPSNIDATKPVDGLPASKAELRANLAAAKAEIEALQTQVATLSPYALRGNRNRIMNGMMRLDIRNNGGTVTIPTTSGSFYTLDRWYGFTLLNGGAGFGVYQIMSGPPGYPYALRVNVSTAKGSLANGDAHGLVQAIEGLQWYDMQWGNANAIPVTLTFWVRCSVAGTFGVSLVSNGGGFSYVGMYTINAANVWEFKTVQIPATMSGTWGTGTSACVGLRFDLGSGANFHGTAGSWVSANRTTTAAAVRLVSNAAANLDITAVQLEPGNIATPFERRLDPLEQVMCERYYETGQFNLAGYGTAGTIIKHHAPFRTTKRAVPGTVSTPGAASNLGSLSSTGAVGGVTAQGTVTATGGYTWETTWTADAEIYA